LDDKLPTFKDLDNEKEYRPAEFVPTNPADPSAGICNIMLRKDDTGVNQMFTEEGEVFEDGTIVEFRYDLDKADGWKWIPIISGFYHHQVIMKNLRTGYSPF
jgi:hypothetical protein